MVQSPRLSRRLILALSSAQRPTRQLTKSRLFSQNCQLLLLSTSSLRPQLPYLHCTAHSPNRSPFQAQLARYLRTEQKGKIKKAARTFAFWTALYWTFAGLVLVAKFGIDNEYLERAHPTPPQWSWISRWKLRSAQGHENPDEKGKATDWAAVADLYKQLLERLEDVNGDGAGVHPQLGEGEEIFVEGIGKTGLDISSRPEPWRRGYYQALMGSARAAEHLDGWVLDTTRGIAFPPEVVKGPSNPRPRPVQFGSKEAPKEEDCVLASKPPQVYYMKILTTHGFTSRQRLDTALAYADWLRYKGLYSSAEDMHAWALDIALDGRPPLSKSPIDKSTGVLRDGATDISPNLLIATTSLAIHHAQTGNLRAALPIFFSVFRAQHDLPPPPPPATHDTSPPPPTSSLQAFINLVSPPSYPPPLPSGDELAVDSPTNTCLLAGTMSYIGEILYAMDLSKDPSSLDLTRGQEMGLGWTKSAVDTAEATLQQIISDSAPRTPVAASAVLSMATKPAASKDEAKARCAECLRAGMGNWRTMVERFEREEIRQRNKAREAEKAAVAGGEKKSGGGGWLWGSGSAKAPVSEGGLHGRWQQEAREVRARDRAVQQLLREEQLDE